MFEQFLIGYRRRLEAVSRLFIAKAPRPRDPLATLVTLGIALAAAVSGFVHLSLGNLLFTLNGAGFLANGLALVGTLVVPRLRYRVRSYMAGWLALYASLTLAGYFLEGAPRSFAAFFALFAEGGIILGAVVLSIAYRRAYERRVRPLDEPQQHWVSSPSLAPFTIAVLAGGTIFFLGANPWAGISCDRATDSEVTIAACDLLFDRDRLVIPAGSSSTVRFENRVAVPHNIAIHEGNLDRIGAERWRGELISGPAIVDYEVPPLAPGLYTFVCSIHPTMAGELVVE